MKNFISFIIITFTLLILSNVVSKGQCQSGYTQQIITLNIGGCNYDIELCYKCSVTDPGEVIINSVIKEPTVPYCSGWDFVDVVNYANAYLTSGQFIYSMLCLWTDIPPCETQRSSKIIKYKMPLCWKELNDYNYYHEHTIKAIPCNSDYCEVSVKYCKNAQGEMITTYLDVTLHDEIPNCPEYDNVNFGECFIVKTQCNP
jgi:hypothetical protein